MRSEDLRGFDDVFWTIEQALAWIITRERKVVNSVSAEALSSAAHRDVYRTMPAWDGWLIPKITQTSSLHWDDAELRGAASTALTELSRALQSAQLIASWRPPGKAQCRTEIPRLFWIDNSVIRNALGFLDVTAGSDEDDNLVRIERSAVMAHWPEKLHAGPAAGHTTVKAKSTAVRLLTELMKASRDVPTMTKEQALKMLATEVPGLSATQARQAWAEAVESASAPVWKKGGRRPSQNLIETPRKT